MSNDVQVRKLKKGSLCCLYRRITVVMKSMFMYVNADPIIMFVALANFWLVDSLLF